MKSYFLVMFLGVNVVFLLYYFLGLVGMLCWVVDYLDYFWFWNKVFIFGFYLSIGLLLFFVFLLWELFIV